MSTPLILQEVYNERIRQDAKWGEQNHDVRTWMLILAEEFGEAAKEANEVHFRSKETTDYRNELIQTAAVCVAALESLGRGHK